MFGARDRERRDLASAVRIVHRDRHLLVLVKPANLPTTAPDFGDRGGTETLTAIARQLDPRARRMHPTSRLDRDVTGLVTFARTEHAIEALLRARREGRYERTYLAIVTGAPEPSEGVWTWPIAVDPRDRRKRIALRDGDRGERAQQARTRYRIRAVAPGGSAALLAIEPETGRTHQIRVHCAAAGRPVAGDVAYGGPARFVLADGRVVTPGRPMLHCARLVLPDLERGGVLELVAQVPEDFVRTWVEIGGAERALEVRVGSADE